MNTVIRALFMMVLSAALPLAAKAVDAPAAKTAPIIVFMTDRGSFAQAHDIAPPAPFIIAKPAKKAN